MPENTSSQGANVTISEALGNKNPTSTPDAFKKDSRYFSWKRESAKKNPKNVINR